MKTTSFFILIVGTSLLTSMTGCSGLSPYPDSDINNLHVTAETASGSIFSIVSASLDIYSVGPGCKTVYEGTVKLSQDKMHVGIPPGRLNYLNFEFSSFAFLPGASSTITYGGLLYSKPGYDYDIQVRYKKNIYSVVIRERSTGGKQGVEIELRPLDTCGKES